MGAELCQGIVEGVGSCQVGIGRLRQLLGGCREGVRLLLGGKLAQGCRAVVHAARAHQPHQPHRIAHLCNFAAAC